MKYYDSYTAFLADLIANDPDAKEAEAACNCKQGIDTCDGCKGATAIKCPNKYD